MSLNSLKIATDGYLKRTTKAVLIIAVAGYLNFGGTPIPPTPPPDTHDGGVFVGGGRSRQDKNDEYERQQEKKRNIERDDHEVLNIIEIFMQCQ